MIAFKDFSGLAIADIPADTEYRHCTFSRPAPLDDGQGGKVGHQLFPGDSTPRTFRNCIMANCVPPAGANVVDCNLVLAEYLIPTTVDEVVVDGVVVSRWQHYDAVIYGRTDPATGDAILNETPVTTAMQPAEVL